MGLDMYLSGKRYLWTFGDHKDVKIAKRIAKLLEVDKEVKQIDIELGYWRKANQIHAWFVNNVQDGEDDCGDYYVSQEQLEELLTLVNKVLDDHDKAEELLPPQSGFFFGGYELDDWYFENLVDTKKIIEDTLKFVKDQHKKKVGISVYYSSSW